MPVAAPVAEETSAAFEAAVEFVLTEEGGYSDDPSDAGGATNFGITQNTLNEYDGKVLLATTRRDVKTITPWDARQVYLALYWNPVCASQFAPSVALALFDSCVLCGQGWTTQAIQRAAWVKVDGKMGPGTAAAILARDPLTVTYALLTLRRIRHQAVADMSPSQVKFLNGWLNRVTACWEKAKALV